VAQGVAMNMLGVDQALTIDGGGILDYCRVNRITRHPARIQVVLGTTTPERVAGAAAGSDIPLTRPEWYELFRAAGHRVP
jgi:predicted oxidoreductase